MSRESARGRIDRERREPSRRRLVDGLVTTCKRLVNEPRTRWRRQRRGPREPADAVQMARHHTTRGENLVALPRSSLRLIAHGVPVKSTLHVVPDRPAAEVGGCTELELEPSQKPRRGPGGPARRSLPGPGRPRIVSQRAHTDLRGGHALDTSHLLFRLPLDGRRRRLRTGQGRRA